MAGGAWRMPKGLFLVCCAVMLGLAAAQCGPDGDRPYPPGETSCPPPPDDGGGGGLGGGAEIDYTTGGPHPAPLRGTIGTVDNPIATDKTLIYGPFEAGFSAAQTEQLFGCSPGITVPGGIDTLTAEQMVQHHCGLPTTTTVLDACGGHANPYHYHERMTCLYTQDSTTGHSTRIGTALDGNGIYGKYVGFGTTPTDLDACGGRFGVTPDSAGQTVYYYMVQDVAPFSVGCFGPVSSVEECRSLYSTCGDGDEMTVTTAQGSRSYDPDCPCWEPTVAPAAAQMACTGGSCGEAGCLCSDLSNSGEACGYHGTMGADCSGCHYCPGSGWIMGTGNTINGQTGTCTATCSSADSEWTACGHPVPPADSVTKTACSDGHGDGMGSGGEHDGHDTSAPKFEDLDTLPADGCITPEEYNAHDPPDEYGFDLVAVAADADPGCISREDWDKTFGGLEDHAGPWDADAVLPVTTCAETREWPELTALDRQTMVTGGLGHMMIEGKIEVWVCLHDKGECLNGISNIARDPTHPDRAKLPEWATLYTQVPAGDSMCYVFHEQLHRMLPWGPNSALKMYQP